MPIVTIMIMIIIIIIIIIIIKNLLYKMTQSPESYRGTLQSMSMTSRKVNLASTNTEVDSMLDEARSK